MLPEAEDVPACLSKPLVRVAVSGGVEFKLVPPPRPVVPWPGRVQGAPMPEAAVYEDGQAGPRENNISSPAWPVQDNRIHPVAQPFGVKQFANGQLGRGVTGLLSSEPRLHRLRHGLGPAR